MTQIDYFCRWSDEAAAKQDADRLANYFGHPLVSDWRKNWFLPNVTAWRPSQDTGTPPNVVHTYLTGWFGILSLDHIEDVILNDNSIAFVLNRDGPPYVIKNNIGAVINDVAVSPIFAGSHYPLGGIS
jgi:hypothetical protein